MPETSTIESLHNPIPTHSKSVTHRQEIFADEKDQYHLDSKDIIANQQLVLFTGKEKIAEVTYYFSAIVIKIFTKKNFNITGNLRAESLRIQAVGQIGFQHELQVDYLNITAQAAHFHRLLRCNAGGHVTVKEKAVFNEKLHVDYFNVSAEEVQLNHTIRTREKVEIIAQQNIHLQGGFLGAGKLILKSQNVNLAKTIRTKKSFEITAENIIRNNADIQAKDICIKTQQIAQDGKLKTTGHCEISAAHKLFCSKNSSLDVGGSFVFNGKKCTLYGEMKVEQGCIIQTEELATGNKLHWRGAHSIHTQKWSCNDGSEIECIHSSPDKASEIYVKNSYASERGAKLNVYSVVAKESAIIFHSPTLRISGSFALCNTRLSSDLLVANKKATVCWEKSRLFFKAGVIDGRVSCRDSFIEIEEISHTSSSESDYQNVYVKQKLKTVADIFRTTGKCTLKNVALHANVELGGQLHMEAVGIEAEQITFQPDSLTTANLTTNSRYLILRSSSGKQNEFKELTATTHILTTENVKLTNSHITAQGNKVFENFGKLDLDNSVIISDGQVFNDKNAQLTVRQADQKQESIKAKYFYNAGEARFDAAKLSADIITHVGKRFDALHATISVKEDLFIKEAQFVLQAESHLEAKAAKIILSNHGEMQVQDQKSTLAAKDVIVLPTAQFNISQQAYAKVSDGLLQLGQGKVDGGGLEVKRLDILGEQTVTRATVFKAETTDVLGKLKATETKLDMGEHVLVRPSGQIEMQDAKLKTKHLEHQGYLKAKKTKSPEDKKKLPAKEKPSAEPTLKLNKLTTSYYSRIEGDDLDLEVDDWHHQGTLAVSGELKAKGLRLLNEGTITAGKTAEVGYNCFINEGEVTANEHLKLKTALTVNAGLLQSHTLETSSFVNLNVGAISAWNSQQNSLLSLNYGLVLPSFDPKQIFSREGMKRVIKQSARAALNAVCPEVSTLVNFASALPGVYSIGKKIYYNVRDNRTRGLFLHDVAELTCDVANLTISAYQLSHHASATPEKEKSAIPEVSAESLSTTAAHIASACLAPQQAERCLGKFNYGAVLSHTIDEMSGFSQNAGLQYATDSVTLNTFSLSNSGHIEGRNRTTLAGDIFYNDSTVQSERVTANFTDVRLGATSQENYANWTVHADDLRINGGHVFSKAHIKANRLTATPSQSGDKLTFEDTTLFTHAFNFSTPTDLYRSQMTGDTLIQSGPIMLREGSQLTLTAHHQLQSGAQLCLDDKSLAVVNTQTVESNAKVSVSNHSTHTVKKEWRVEKDAEIIAINNTRKVAVTDDTNKDGEKTKIELTGGFTAGTLHSEGNFTLHDSHTLVDGLIEFSRQAKNVLSEGGFKGATIIDEGTLTYSRYCSMEADRYEHRGDIQVERGRQDKYLFYVQCNTAQLAGRGSIDNAIFSIQHLVGDANAFVLGQGDYQRYQFTEGLNFITQDAFHLRGPMNRACNLSLAGSAIVYDIAHNGNYNVALQSSVGDVVIQQDVNLNNLIVNSAGAVINHVNINTNQEVFIHAAKNIENHGKVIRGGDYCELYAGGNILNLAGESTYRVKHDVMKEYTPAIIAGGTRGVLVKAKGHVKNDASTIEGIGDVYIEGGLGVDFDARSHTYISEKHKEEGWLGWNKKRVVNTATQVQGSRIHSQTGRNIIYSPSGTITGVATQFIGAKGSDLYAEQQHIRLYDLRTDGKRYEKTSSAWGLFKDKHTSRYQEAVPTLFFDHGTTRIHANKGDVVARGTAFLGKGDLYIAAGNDIYLSPAILNHFTRHTAQSVGVSCFGINGASALQQGGSLWQALAAEDSTLAKGYKFFHSDSATALASNGVNLGISAFNAANSFATGFNQGALGTAFLQRYGLGDARGLDPTISVSLNRSDTRSHYQTMGPGGIDRGHVSLTAGNKLTLDNGMAIHATSATVRAKEMDINAAALQTKQTSKARNIKIGVTASGEIVNVGAGQSIAHMNSTRHVNAALNVKGHLDIQVGEANLRGGNIECQTISGHVEKPNAESQQDRTSERSSSFALDTSGMCSVSRNSSTSATIAKASGIHVRDGINHEERTFTVGKMHLKGAKVTSDGAIHPFADEITAESIHDYQRSRGISLGANLQDIRRFSADAKPQTKNGTHAVIGTAAVGFNSTHMRATQQATIYGARGTELNGSQLTGSLNTSNSSGYRVHREDKTHINLDVPITTPTSLGAACKNIANAATAIQKPAFVIPSSAPTFTSDDLPPLLPSSAHPKKHKVPYVKLKTYDTRVSLKDGRRGKQLYDIDDGRYINSAGIVKKIIAKNTKANYFSQETQFVTRRNFFSSQPRILWQASENDSLIRPSLIDDGGYASFNAEYNPFAKKVNVKLEAGRNIRFNIMQGSHTLLDCIETQYSVDLAGVSSSMQIGINNERGITAEARAELGVMGPSVSGLIRWPEICIGGYSLQCDTAANVGVGAKIALGAGITADKTQPRLRTYLTAGGFFGVGYKGSVIVNTGIDTEYTQQLSQELTRLRSVPENRQMSENLNRLIIETQQQSPSTFLGGLWDAYSVECWQEVEQEHHERMRREASTNLNYGFKVRRPR